MPAAPAHAGAHAGVAEAVPQRHALHVADGSGVNNDIPAFDN
ncbi:hypothetical protein ACFZAU_13565 [Streptomyces sp. NPDC008238]